RRGKVMGNVEEAVSVEDIWARIEGWLKQHHPAATGALRQGASEASITDFEALMDTTLPEALKQSWRVHDGLSSGGYVGEWRLLSLKSIVKHINQMRIQSVAVEGGEKIH